MKIRLQFLGSSLEFVPIIGYNFNSKHTFKDICLEHYSPDKSTNESIIFFPPAHTLPFIKGKPLGPITFLQDISQIF